MWNTSGKPRPSSMVGGVILYTEEDVELACYVRQHYANLHVLSGSYMTFYFFEYMPPSKGSKGVSVRDFWAEKLPPKLNSIWCLFGMTKTKPHLNEQIYHIAEGIGVTPDHIPCIVIFRKWEDIKVNRIILSITQPYPQFFRQACTDVKQAIESYQGERNEQDFLSLFTLQDFRSHLPRWWDSKQDDDFHREEKQTMHKKILFLFACPRDANRIRVDEEERVVRECFERAQLREVITWSSRHAVRVDDLRRAILDEKPDIVHFSGHGTGGTIVLENELGSSYPVPIDALGSYLSSKDLECVILNACTTKTLGHAISGTVTISMPNPISDRAAIEFTRAFMIE